jgi:hypothetical protein
MVYAQREKKVQLLVFWDDQEMDAILLIIGIAYGVFRIVIKSIQQCTYFHFSPFENENYHRFVISLQANNLTSLSPYATDLTSDR